MLTALMLAALQTAAPATPTPPAADKADRTIVRELVIHEHHDKSAAKDGRQERREIMIIRSGDHAGKTTDHSGHRVRIVDVAPGKDGAAHDIRILRRPGGPHTRVNLVDCDPASRFEDETIATDGKKTRVMICATGGDGQVRVEALESAAKRIAENQHLSEDVRTRVVSRLNEEIGRLKATK